MYTLLFFFLLVAAGALACERLDLFRRRPWVTGLVFGLLSVASDFLAPEVRGGWFVLARGALPIAATLYFGWRAGLVAGVAATIWSAGACLMLRPAGGAGASVVCWMLATAVVTAYALAVARWLFDFNRPDPVSATVIAGFGVVLHFALDACSGCETLATMVEVFSAVSVWEMAMYAAVVGIVAFVCGEWRGGLRGVLTGNAFAMVSFALAAVLFARLQERRAGQETAAAVRDAQQRLDHDLDDQIGYLLHRCACSIVDYLGSIREVPLARMQDVAKMFDIDEINFVARSGRVVASTDARVLANPERFGLSAGTRDFMSLTNGVTRFVKQRFRPSRSNAAIVAKYIGVPFPDGDGFVQVGYGRDRFERDFEKYFFPMLVDMTVGESGYYVVANDETGTVAIDAAGHSGIAGRSLAEIGLVRPADSGDHFSAFEAVVCGTRSLCLDRHIGAWSVYCVVPLADAHGPALRIRLFGSLMLLVVCVVFRAVVRRFRLAHEKIDQLRACEDARREKDLVMARTIQLSSLRTDNPETSRYRIAGGTSPARDVGGDFYDYQEMLDGRVFVAIADVSGKGIPAALFMMRARTLLKASVNRASVAIDEAVAIANVQLCANNDAQMFVTLWAGLYDPATRKLAYVNAGHNPPLVRHADGRTDWLRDRSGLALAVVDGAKYRVREVALEPGDTLYLYTDGVTEAMNAAGEQFGEERLERAVRASRGDLAADVASALAGFVDGAEQSDDITSLTFVVKA